MKPNKLLFFIFAMAFFCTSVVDQSSGPLVPQFKEIFRLNSSEIGLLFLCTSFIFVVVVRLVGMIVFIELRAKIMIVALCIAIFGLFTLYKSVNLVGFVLGNMIVAVGAAGLSIVVNLSIPQIKMKKQQL